MSRIEAGAYSRDAANISRFGAGALKILGAIGIAANTAAIPLEMYIGVEIRDNVTKIIQLGALTVGSMVELSLLEGYFTAQADKLQEP